MLLEKWWSTSEFINPDEKFVIAAKIEIQMPFRENANRKRGAAPVT
jgi:hypothetical protein